MKKESAVLQIVWMDREGEKYYFPRKMNQAFVKIAWLVDRGVRFSVISLQGGVPGIS